MKLARVLQSLSATRTYSETLRRSRRQRPPKAVTLALDVEPLLNEADVLFTAVTIIARQSYEPVTPGQSC